MSNSPVFTLSAPAVLSRCPGFPLSRANIGSPAAGHKPATPAPMTIGQYTVRAGKSIPVENGIVCRAVKSIIQMLLVLCRLSDLRIYNEFCFGGEGLRAP